jgi:hypothetical protein
MPVPSQGHYGFHSFPVVDWFVCLYNYEFWLSLCKIVRSSVILLLPLFIIVKYLQVAVFFLFYKFSFADLKYLYRALNILSNCLDKQVVDIC